MAKGKTLGEYADEIVREALCALDDDRWQPVTVPAHYHQWTWAQLDSVRRESRRLFLRNEFAIGGTDCRLGYCIGDGFQYEFVSREGATADTGLLKTLNDWLTRWLEATVLDEIEEETFLRNDRDGETFLRLFADDDPELPAVRFVEPERVRSAGSPGDTVKGMPAVGVITSTTDAQKVEGYWIESAPGEQPERVPEEEVVHFKCHADSACLRGVPVYYPVFSNLNRAEDLLTSMSAMAKARAKIAILIKSANLTREKAEDVVSRLTTSVQPMPDGTAKRVTIEDLPFGAMIRTNAGDEWEMPSAGVGAADLVDVLQADLRAVGSRLVMPEWMFTGLADQKYSNAFVVEAPTLKRFKRLARFHARRFGEWNGGPGKVSLVWRALKLTGQFTEDQLADVRCKVTTPSLESRDQATEANTNKTYIDLGVKDVQLVQEELGIDPDVAARIQAEKDAKPKPPAGGPPAPGQGGSVSQPDPNAPKPPTPPGTQTPQQPSAADLMSLLGKTTESLAAIATRLASGPGEWLTESRAEPVFLLGEWYDPDALSWVLEGRDRSHLVKTRVQRKDGHWTTVYKRPQAGTVAVSDSTGTGGGTDPSSSPRSSSTDRDRRLSRVQSILAKPANEGLAGIGQLTDDLAHLTRDQIRQVVKDRGLQVGGRKRELADRLIADAKTRLDPEDKRQLSGDPNAPTRTSPDSMARYSDAQMSNPDNAKARADVMGLLKRSGLADGKRVQVADVFRESGLTEVQLHDALGQLNQLGALNLGWKLRRKADGVTTERAGLLPTFVEAGPGYDQWTPDGKPAEPPKSILRDMWDTAVDDVQGFGRALKSLARGIGSLFRGRTREPDTAPPLAPYRESEVPPTARPTVAKLTAGLDAAGPEIGPEKRARYAEAARTVAARIPDAGHARIEAHLAESRFYPDSASLTKGVLAAVVAAHPGDDGTRDWAASERERIESGRARPFAGAYLPRSMGVHLDGPPADAGPTPFGMQRSEEQVYAHELGHAIDGPSFELSKSDAWVRAFAADISNVGREPPLTRYGGATPREGFAEFSRLLYGTGHDLGKVETAFPTASRFFKERGLWPRN